MNADNRGTPFIICAICVICGWIGLLKLDLFTSSFGFQGLLSPASSDRPRRRSLPGEITFENMIGADAVARMIRRRGCARKAGVGVVDNHDFPVGHLRPRAVAAISRRIRVVQHHGPVPPELIRIALRRRPPPVDRVIARIVGHPAPLPRASG